MYIYIYIYTYIYNNGIDKDKSLGPAVIKYLKLDSRLPKKFVFFA